MTFEEMYKDLITEDDVGNFLGHRSYVGDEDDDIETFATTEELKKAEEKESERFGRKPAQPAEIEESITFKSYTKKRVHKYTESEMKAIREACELSVVHDYGEHDIFHMSDEERAENDMLAELGMKLGGLKRTYRRVDQYIEAMRIVIQAWKLLESKANFIHKRDEFFTLVGEGRIVSNRIIMPKLKRMNDFNIDKLIRYISDEELDPKDLLEDTNVDKDIFDETDSFIEDREDYQKYYNEYMEEHRDDEDVDEFDQMNNADLYAKNKMEEDEFMQMLGPDEAEYIHQHIDDPAEIEVRPLKRRYIKNYDQGRRLTRSKKKKLKKSDRVIREDVHDILRKIQQNPRNVEGGEYSRSYTLTNNIFDTDKPFRDFWEDLRYEGSWADEYSVYLYNLAVREEMLKQHPPKDRYLTYADKELDNFFRIAEANGINTIELRRKMELSESGSVSARSRTKQEDKENKKLEAAIINRITSLNDKPKFKKLVSKAEKALNRYYGN